MDTQKVIDYWQTGAKDAFDTAEKLMQAKKYHHALFFCHLALEKTIKAAVVIHTKTHALPIHDLVKLAISAGIQLTPNQEKDLGEIDTFNLKARYDEYKLRFYQKATQNYATKWFNKTQEYLQWLTQL